MSKRTQRSKEAERYRKLYKTAQWQALRKATFSRDLYTCRMCGKYAGPSPVCDHIKAHKGNLSLFLDTANLRTLCKPCHDRHAQAQAHGTMKQRIGPDGWPVD